MDVTVGPVASGDGFYIADTGSGIPREDRDAVFESGMTTSEDGTGLGLSIVEQICEAHGWDVEIVESEGGGAKFVVSGVTCFTE